MKGLTELAMADTTPSLNDNSPTLASDTIKDAFYEWLEHGNVKNGSAHIVVQSIDKASKYAINRKFSTKSIWHYGKPNAFKAIYDKLSVAKLFRLTDKSTYKNFIVAGQLYMKFLKELQAIAKEQLAVTSNAVEKEATVSSVAKPIIMPISTKDFTSWLVTQTNSVGTLYLENVARSYASALKNAPARLELPEVASKRVFDCRSPEELSDLWQEYKQAPNYKKVNVGTSGAFQAGMRCLLRYLQHLSEDGENNIMATTIQSTTPHTFNETYGKVLSLKYPNGFLLNSPIELIRFRSFAEIDDIISDDELRQAIKSCGVFHDGKVYVVSAQTKERLRSEVEEYFSGGGQAIFFTEFYDKHNDWLFRSSVISEDMLINVLQELFPKLIFTATYFGFKKTTVFAVLVSEVLRVWGDDVLQSYEQLSERLKYIPLDRIKYALGRNTGFIWNNVGVFSHVSKIAISDIELNEVVARADKECFEHGYVSITDLPVEDIQTHNHKLTITAVHNAVFQVCLSADYVKNGKIITRKGQPLDALSIIKEYCRGVERCTLKELLELEIELTGERHHWIPMGAANDTLVRLDKENYVSDNYVCFDIEATDKAIERFVTDDFLPLKAFTTFSFFPDCGQTWNLFVLESFCRRFSRKFRFDTPSVNSRNAGAVICKNCHLGYIDILSRTVAEASVTLDDKAIGVFLYEGGYIGRKSTSKAKEIAEKAKILREGRQ
jgi:hypothetical protein